MKPTLSPAALVLAIGLALGPLGAPSALAQSKRATEPVTLNFVGAEIEAVARTMATITGRNVVVDPRVKGTVNLATERPVSPTAALNQFAAVLRLQGFSIVDTGGLYKIQLSSDNTVTITNPWTTAEDWMAPDKGKEKNRAIAEFMAKQAEVPAVSIFGGSSYRIVKIKGPLAAESFPAR